VFTIAIDGPAGSGKSTAAKATAHALGCGYLDTGAMYRAVAVRCLESRVDQGDADRIASMCRTMSVDISTDPDDPRVLLDGRDVTAQIRTPEVSSWVPAVSTNAQCRTDLVRRQQEILASGSFVAEGRDITTVVAPNAEVRVLLTADPTTRMARRGAELGGRVDADGLRDQVIRRDRDDSTLVNFTEAADGVVTIDSTLLSADEVVERILRLAANAGIPVPGVAAWMKEMS